MCALDGCKMGNQLHQTSLLIKNKRTDASDQSLLTQKHDAAFAASVINANELAAGTVSDDTLIEKWKDVTKVQRKRTARFNYYLSVRYAKAQAKAIKESSDPAQTTSIFSDMFKFMSLWLQERVTEETNSLTKPHLAAHAGLKDIHIAGCHVKHVWKEVLASILNKGKEGIDTLKLFIENWNDSSDTLSEDTEMGPRCATAHTEGLQSIDVLQVLFK